MAILKIARMGHPILSRPAAAVDDPSDPVVARLIADMTETLADIRGAGLAAPQVHVPLRVVLFQVPASRAGQDADDQPVPLTVLINPVLEPIGEEKQTGWEACLSVPGLMGAVARYKRLRYRALDREGAMIERIASGFHARVVQHECDHLDGVLYPMRMTDMSQLGFVDEMQLRFAEARDADVD